MKKILLFLGSHVEGFLKIDLSRTDVLPLSVVNHNCVQSLAPQMRQASTSRACFVLFIDNGTSAGVGHALLYLQLGCLLESLETCC